MGRIVKTGTRHAISAVMVGNVIAKVAVGHHAEPNDLWLASRMVRSSTDVRNQPI
jgi:hypothetical protein